MTSKVSSEFEPVSMQDLVIEKLEALVKLARAGKIVKGEEQLEYDPDGKASSFLASTRSASRSLTRTRCCL